MNIRIKEPQLPQTCCVERGMVAALHRRAIERTAITPDEHKIGPVCDASTPLASATTISTARDLHDFGFRVRCEWPPRRSLARGVSQTRIEAFSKLMSSQCRSLSNSPSRKPVKAAVR